MRHGKTQYLPIERAFSYEHGSPYKISDKATCDKLLAQIDEYDFYADPIEDRIQINRLCDFLKGNPISHFNEQKMAELADKIDCTKNLNQKISILEGLVDFIHLEPELPEVGNKTFGGAGPIALHPQMSRDEVFQYLENARATHSVAELAFYASRDLAVVDWKPFLKAALERNPVIVEATREMSDTEVFQTLEDLENESIYDGTRVAQPDEVWNFQRGDGVECAIALADVLKVRYPEAVLELAVNGLDVRLTMGQKVYSFKSEKELQQVVAL